MFRYLLFLLFLLIPQVSFASVRLAVLEFQGAGIDPNLLQLLTDEVRTGIVHVTKGEKIKGEKLIIMTRENMMQVLKDQGLSAEDCVGECEVEIAKNIGADYVISGNVTKIGTLFALVVKLHSTADSNLLASESFKTKSAENLVNDSGKVGAKVFQEGLNLSPKQQNASAVSSGFQGGFSQEEDSDWVIKKGKSKGIVHFTSTPSGATVMMNGKLVCPSTPCKKNLVLGKHNISIQRERYFEWKEQVTLAKGTKVNAILKPTFGYFEVMSSFSGVSLFMNGNKLGKTPISRRELDPGRYNIRIKDNCYKGPEYRFELKPGDTEVVDYPIKQRQSGIDVSVVESNGDDVSAKVYVDGKPVGDSPEIFQVPLCSKEVTVVVRGNRIKQSLSLKEREVAKVEFRLPERKQTVSTTRAAPRRVERRSYGKGYETTFIRQGVFMMGCTLNDGDCQKSEKPRHEVTISHNFYMMKSEVTQGLYESLMGENPSQFKGCGIDCPVENVSWLDAVKMANKLSQKEGLETCYSISGADVSWYNKDCEGWRLPTEAEWEYAARGGENYKYAGSGTTRKVSWYSRNSTAQTHPVCRKALNGYGLCDMSGNVQEWVYDSWRGSYGFSTPESNPVYIDLSSSENVFRGGSWYNNAWSSRVSRREHNNAAYRSNSLGFRLLRAN
ncbi:MAG: SUMF1/EgtB/PvdO family nonheme iron enzyme [Myxococcota bacterium]|nr:SUMF1/EgtB/PvdO family nonheme iron enzyme [Myxococcota bacterium]